VCVLKTLGNVQWLETNNGTTVLLYKTLLLKFSVTLNMFI